MNSTLNLQCGWLNRSSVAWRPECSLNILLFAKPLSKPFTVLHMWGRGLGMSAMTEIKLSIRPVGVGT